MTALRREPFRIFFPLGMAIGATGMLPWLLFALRKTHSWPGTQHAFTMTQGFLTAIAIGFLGTMIPRRTGSATMSRLELTALALGSATMPALAWRGQVVSAQLVFLVVLAVLASFVLRRFRATHVKAGGGVSRRPPPPSFVLIPLALLHAVVGAGLIVWFHRTQEAAWTLALGQRLAQQGFLLGLVLALAPMLTPIFVTGDAAPDGTPQQRARRRALYAAAGLLLFASFVIEVFGNMRLGLGLRAGIAFAVIGLGTSIAEPARRRGIHRTLFRLALIAIPSGIAAAVANPLSRISFLHITFVAGLTLLVVAVTVHVTLLHTGREREAERSAWPVVVAGLLLGGATLARIAMELYPKSYVESLRWASSLWLAAASVWALYLVPKLVFSRATVRPSLAMRPRV